MFTGLVEEMGIVERISHSAASSVLSISAKTVLEGLKIGDSVSTCGVCLTVTKLNQHSFSADVMPESIKRSNLGALKPGAAVNLERALCLGDRLGGHLVSGHIDGTGQIVSIKTDDNAVWYEIQAPVKILKYIIEKGSVAIDGISLTVATAGASTFAVSVIPHTNAETTLQYRNIGDMVNVECDLFGKYIERFSQFDTKDEKESGIDFDFLSKHGFA